MSDQAAACPHCGAPAGGTFAGAPGPRRGHGWEGKLYVGLCYAAAVFIALGGLLILVMPMASEPRIRDTAEPGMILASYGGLTALMFACARGVQRFRAWGWWLATGISLLAVVVCVYALLNPPAGTAPSSVRTSALLFIAFHAVFLRYFLARRRDFGIGV
ncbi:hypothetical protein [Longimicrobium sp.]|uniref:hypothetical protein n=1 Tax=Longimicrobium sp. TaxID=2029185 RepID=UPI002E321F43|nr:hypothetical protein [Longimicrobium sp.]HEX6037435.1 hypothetical protein [Longimicrobium sp.]